MTNKKKGNRRRHLDRRQGHGPDGPVLGDRRRLGRGVSGTDDAGKAAEAIERAQEGVSHTVAEALEVRAGLDLARARARAEVDERSSELGRYIGDLEPDVRATGEYLRERGRDEVADLLDQIADRMQGASQYLEYADVDRLTNDLAHEVRERPAVVLAAAGALGLAAARALRADRPDADGSDLAEGHEPVSAAEATTGEGSATGTEAVGD